MHVTVSGKIRNGDDFRALVEQVNQQFQANLANVAAVAQREIRDTALTQRGSNTLGIVTGTLNSSLIAAAQKSGAVDSFGAIHVFVQPNINPDNQKPATYYGELHELGRGWLTYGLVQTEPEVVIAAESEIQKAITSVF